MKSDPFLHFDGAYVLGALDAGERAEFELHLASCAECRARVDEVAPTADLLAGLPAGFVLDDLPSAEPMPDTLLPGLLRRARRESTRRRVVTGAVAVVAAACVVALAVLLWPSTSTPSRPAPREQAMTAIGTSPVTATAALVSKRWGTEIDVKCHYSEAVDEDWSYGLRVIDKAGKRYDAGTWKLVRGQVIRFSGGTQVARDQIARVLVTRGDGTPILQLKL